MTEHRGDTRRLLAVASLNGVATGLLGFILPWMALELGRPVSDAALLSVVFNVAYTVTLAPSGAAGDHWGHRRILRVTFGAQALAALVIAVAILSGHISLALLVALGIVLGAGTSFANTSAYAAMAAAVHVDRMPLAFTRLTVGRQIGVFGGPAVGGLIYAIGGVRAVAVAVAAACSASFLLSTTLSGRYARRRNQPRTRWHHTVKTMAFDRHMRLLFAAGFVWNLPAGATLTLAVPLMHAHLHLSSLGTAAILGVGAVGSISVAPLMRNLGIGVDLNRVCAIAMAAQGALLIAVGSASTLLLLLPLYGLMMLSNTTVASGLLAARSQRIPLEQQATAVGVGMFIQLLGYTLGGGAGALMAKSLSLPTVYAILGASMFMWALFLARAFRAGAAPATEAAPLVAAGRQP